MRTGAIRSLVTRFAFVFAAIILAQLFPGDLKAQAPTEPTGLFVGSAEAQTGTQGNPVSNIALSPKFSAVFNHSITTSISKKARVQVASDSAFVTVIWTSGQVAIPDVSVGSRCADLGYVGPNLSGQTNYYWRVRFWDQADNLGSWSTEGASFTTQAAPLAPVTLFVDSTNAQSGTQGDPVSEIDLKPHFSAVFQHQSGAAIAKKAKVQAATDSAFANVVWTSGQVNIADTAVGSRIPDVAHNGTAFQSDTTYYWRIRSYDANGYEGPWSTETASFHTVLVPSLPTSLFVDSTSAQAGTFGNPVNGLDLTPMFSAIFNHPSGTALGKQVKIQVTTDPSFATITHWNSGKKTIPDVTPGSRCADIAYGGAALTISTVYYWRIRFFDQNASASQWSTEAASFNTSGSPLEPDTLYVDSTAAQTGTAGDPVSGIDTTPVFSAIFHHQNNAAQAVEARFRIATDAAFTNLITTSSWRTIAATGVGSRSPAIGYTGSALAGLTRYYWQFKFRDAGANESPWSTEAASFVTVPLPTEPTQLFVGSTSAQSGAQGNPVLNIDTTPAFSALFNHQSSLATVSQARVQISANAAFSTIVWNSGWRPISTTTAGNRCSDIAFTGTPLGAGQTYYWRIRFRNTTADTTPWNIEQAGFTTQSGAPNQNPSLAPLADQFVSEGVLLTVHVSGSDPDMGQVLSYSADDGAGGPLPSGAAFSPTLQDFTWTPNFAQAGVYAIRFTVTDNGSPPLSASQTIYVVVTDQASAPALLHVGNDSAQAGRKGDPVLGIGLTPRFSAVFNHPDAGASSTLAQIQVSTDGTFATVTHWDSPAQSISSATAGTRSTDVTYGGSALAVDQTYWWRIRFGYASGAWTEWSSERASFLTTGLPNAPHQLFVGGASAQNGQNGDPVQDVDLTPVFSAIFDHPNQGAATGHYRIQVSTDSTFAAITHWSSAILPMAQIHAGGRSANLPYGGATLTPGQRYYWRILFIDDLNNPTPWSTELASFLTTPLLTIDFPNLMIASDRTMEFDLNGYVSGGTTNNTFSLLGGPSFVAVNGTTLRFTPATSDEAGSPYTINVQVDDGVSVATDASTITVVTPIPNAPSNLVGTALDETRILWSWTDNSGTESGFRLVNTEGHEIAECAADQTSLIEDGLFENTAYARKLVAVGPAGDESSATGIAQTATLVKQPTASDCFLYAESTEALRVFFYPPTNSKVAQTGLFVERATSLAFNPQDLWTTPGFVTYYSYRDTVVLPGATYYYRLTYRNQDGISGTPFVSPPVTVPTEDYYLTASNGEEQLVSPTGVTAETLDVAIVDNQAAVVTGLFGGTPVDFSILTGTAATFTSTGTRVLSTAISSGTASAGTLSMNGETVEVIVEASATFNDRLWKVQFKIVPTFGATSIEQVIPAPSEGPTIPVDLGTTLSPVRVRVLDVNGAPMGGATVNFSLQDAHGPGSCSFVGIPNPKVVDVVTDPAGLADTPSIDIAGTGSFSERLVASVTDPSSGVHSRAFVISAMRITPNNEPPVPLIVEPFGGDQEVPAGEVFNPVGVRVLNANTLEPVEGVFVRIRTASVPVDTVLPPYLPTTVYDRDHPLRPWGPLNSNGVGHLPTHQYGKIHELIVNGTPEGRTGHRGVVLADGRIFITGGRPSGAFGATADSILITLDGADCDISVVPGVTPREEHEVVYLGGNMVLITGGVNSAGNPVLAELVDLGNLTVTPLTGIPQRRQASVIALPGGDLLLVGGFTGAGVPQNSVVRLHPSAGGYTADPPISFSVAAERRYPGLFLDQSSGLLWIVGSRTTSPVDAVERFDVVNGTFLSALTVPSTSSGTSFEPRTGVVSSSWLVVVGKEGAVAVPLAPGATHVAIETPFGETPAIHALPLDSDPAAGGNDDALFRGIIIGTTQSKLVRIQPPSPDSVSFLDAPHFDDPARSSSGGFISLQLNANSAYGRVFVVGGGTSATMETFTEPRALINISGYEDPFSSDPFTDREPVLVTNTDGEVFFSGIVSSKLLGRQTLRMHATDTDESGLSLPATEAFTYVNLYSYKPDTECENVGATPSSGGLQQPNQGGSKKPADKETPKLPQTKFMSNATTVKWLNIPKLEPVKCLDERCVMQTTVFLWHETPSDDPNIVTPPFPPGMFPSYANTGPGGLSPAGDWSAVFNVEAVGAGGGGRAKVEIKEQEEIEFNGFKFVTKYVLRIHAESVSAAAEDVKLICRGYGVEIAPGVLDTAIVSTTFTIVDLELEICSPGEEDNFLYTNQDGDGEVKATLLGPSTIALRGKLEIAGPAVATQDSFIVKGGTTTRVGVKATGPSTALNDITIKGVLYTWEPCICDDINATSIGLDVEVCGSMGGDHYLFRIPKAKPFSGDFKEEYNSDPFDTQQNCRAQFTPGKLTLLGPQGFNLDATYTLMDDSGGVYVWHSAVQYAATGEKIPLVANVPKRIWVEARGEEVGIDRAKNGTRLKFCISGKLHLEPEVHNTFTGPSWVGSDFEVDAKMYAPPGKSASTPGPNTFGMEAKDPAKETVAGGPKSPDQKGKENDPCELCRIVPTTVVQVIACICDVTDDQEDDWVCANDPMAMEQPFTYMYVKLLGPEEVTLPVSVFPFRGEFGAVGVAPLQVDRSALNLRGEYPKNNTYVPCDDEQGITGTSFSGLIRSDVTEVVKITPTSDQPSPELDIERVGIFFECNDDDDTGPEPAARRDLKVEAGFLMVNVEALTIVKLELKPCETSDIEDDLVLKDGDEHVLLEIQPSPTSLRKLDHFEVFTSTPMFAGLRKTVPADPCDPPSTQDETVVERISLEATSDLTFYVHGVAGSSAVRDAKIHVEAGCEHRLRPCKSGQAQPPLEESPVCVTAELTVYEIDLDLPAFICVNETGVAGTINAQAPFGTPQGLGGQLNLVVQIETSGPAAYQLSTTSFQFVGWNQPQQFTVSTGSNPSAAIEDVETKFVAVVDACVQKGCGPHTTVYKVEAELEALCLEVGEGFQHPQQVTGRFDVMPGLPPRFDFLELSNAGAPTLTDPELPAAALPATLHVFADGVGQPVDVPTTAGFGKQNVSVMISVDGQLVDCGDHLIELAIGGLPTGVAAEQQGSQTLFVNTFSMYAGVQEVLPIREIPVGIGSFQTNIIAGTFNAATQSDGVKVGREQPSKGPNTLRTTLTMGSHSCQATFQITFVVNQGPDCHTCFKPKEVGPLIGSPPTAGGNNWDMQDVGDPVQLDRGDLSIGRCDLQIEGRGFDFAHTRAYRGMSQSNTVQGRGWDFGYNLRLEFDTNGDAVLVEGDKTRREVYPFIASGVYGSPDQHFTTLLQLGTQFRLLEAGGMATWFDINGRMVRREDANGNRMDFLYTDSQNPFRLTRVLDTMGRPIDYGYYPASDSVVGRQGKLKTVTDFAGRQVLYDYDADGHLISARSPIVTGTSNGNDFPDGKVEKYEYYTGTSNPKIDHKLHRIIQANENESRAGFGSSTGVPLNSPTFEYTYDTEGRVESQRWGGTGQDISYQYKAVFLAGSLGRNPIKRLTKIIDRNGNETEYYFSADGQTVEKRELTRGVRAGDPASFITRWRYNKFNQVVRQTMPEGDYVEYEYDNGVVTLGGTTLVDARLRANINEIRRYPGPRNATQSVLVTRFVIEPFYCKPSVIIDPRGHDTTDNLRFAQRTYFDWEEGNNLQKLAQYFVPHLSSTPNYGAGWQYVNALALRTHARMVGLNVDSLDSVSAANITVGQDMNGDGETGRISGNVVRALMPKVLLTAQQQDALGAPSLDQYVSMALFCNRFGQPTGSVDAEGNINTVVYHATEDPTGNGTPSPEVIRDDGSISGGYEHAIISDQAANANGIVVARYNTSGQLVDELLGTSLTSPIPRSSTATPVNATLDDEHNIVGVKIALTDPRGTVTTFEVNALDQVVKVTAPAPYSYSTSFFYDANNNVVKTTIENAVVQLDSNGRLQLQTTGSFANLLLATGTTASFEHRFKFNILDDLTEQDIDATTPTGSSQRLLTTFAYDPNQNLTTVIKPMANTVQTQYDERDLVFSVTRGFGSADSSRMEFDYDRNMDLVRVLDGTNDPTNSVYDGYNRLTEVLDAKGNRLRFAYDAAGNRLSSTLRGPINGQSTTEVDLVRSYTLYDELSRPFLSKMDIYDETGAPVASGGPTSANTFVQTLTAFDRSSRVAAVIEDDGALNSTTHATTALRYDGMNRLIERIDALGNTNSYMYDAASNLLEALSLHVATDSVTVSETYKTKYEYDVLNRLARVTDNLFNTSQFGYDSRNNQTHSTDALGNTSLSVFDGASRLVESIRNMRGTGSASITDDAINTLYAYDANSRLTSVTDDAGNATGYQYDALDRLKITTYANAATVTLTYDEDDNVITRTDQNGTLITNAYDAINRLTSRTIAPNNPVTTEMGQTNIVGTTQQAFEYDGANRLTKSTDNNDAGDANDDAQCEYVYDSLSRVVSETQTYGSQAFTVSYNWQSDNREESVTNPGGNVVSRVFDALDRVTSQSWTASGYTAGPEHEQNYIGTGRALKRNVLGVTTRDFHDPNDATKSGYDGLARPVYLNYAPALSGGQLLGTLTYGYDAVSNENFEHDTSVVGTLTASRRNLESYSYDAAYRLVDFGASVSAGSSGSTSASPTVPQTTTQAGGNRLNGQQVTNPGAATVSTSLQWALDGVGSWQGFTENGNTSTNTTGALNQYTSFKNLTLDHAPNGNTIVDVSQLCTPSGPPPSQSSSMTETGSQSSASTSTQSLPPPSDTQVRYEYDGLNRLRKVLCTDTQTQTTHALGIYSYDASGRRIFRKADEDHDENTGAGGLEIQVRYVFDGDREVEERNAAGGMQREYVFGNYIDEPLWMRTYTGSNAGEYLFAQDENFNVYALMAGGFGFGASSNATGTILEQYRYDAYGSFQRYTPSAPGVGPWTESGARNTKSLFDNPWLFQGRRFDVESNLFFFRARYFNPVAGRFISHDPRGYKDSMALYEFVNSTPIIAVDPSGLKRGFSGITRGHQKRLERLRQRDIAESANRKEELRRQNRERQKQKEVQSSQSKVKQPVGTQESAEGAFPNKSPKPPKSGALEPDVWFDSSKRSYENSGAGYEIHEAHVAHGKKTATSGNFKAEMETRLLAVNAGSMWHSEGGKAFASAVGYQSDSTLAYKGHELVGGFTVGEVSGGAQLGRGMFGLGANATLVEGHVGGTLDLGGRHGPCGAYKDVLGLEAGMEIGIGAGVNFDWNEGITLNAAVGVGGSVTLKWGEYDPR